MVSFGNAFGPDESYRTCSECLGDCPPEPLTVDHHLQVAFICPEHGIQTVGDPFFRFRDHNRDVGH